MRRPEGWCRTVVVAEAGWPSVKADGDHAIAGLRECRNELEDCVFADRDRTRPIAEYRFPQDGTLPRDAFQLVSDELMPAVVQMAGPGARQNAIRSAGILPTRGPESAAQLWRIVPRG
jgi:hypothetical protein